MSRHAFALALFAPLLASGCTEEVAPAAFVTDHATWTALPDEDAQRASAVTLVDRWKGKTVRWPALALAGLCVPKDGGATCAMNPFARDTAEASALGGVFPLYRFEAVQLAALKQACAGLDRCVVDVEAKITDLRLDPDEPLGVWLTAAKVHGGRAPKDSDGWARPKPAREGPPPTLPLRSTSAPALRLPTIPTATF